MKIRTSLRDKTHAQIPQRFLHVLSKVLFTLLQWRCVHVQPCGSVLVLWWGPSCSLMVWRRRHTGGWGELLPVWLACCGGTEGPRVARLSSPPSTCSSSKLKEARWTQLSQKSPTSSLSSASHPSRLSISLSSAVSWPVPPAPLRPFPCVLHTHTSIPESPVNLLLLPAGSRSLSSMQLSDRSFNRGSLQDSSSLLFSWLSSASSLSPSDSRITPEPWCVWMGLLSGLGLKSSVAAGCGSSVLDLQHSPSETGGAGLSERVGQCPSCCSEASGLGATEDGPVCKAL